MKAPPWFDTWATVGTRCVKKNRERMFTWGGAGIGGVLETLRQKSPVILSMAVSGLGSRVLWLKVGFQVKEGKKAGVNVKYHSQQNY